VQNLVGKREERYRLGDLRRLENNIKTDRGGIECESVYWFL